MGRILTAWSVLGAQTCGLWPGLLGHAPVTALWPLGRLARRRLFVEREKAEAWPVLSRPELDPALPEASPTSARYPLPAPIQETRGFQQISVME